MTEGKEPPDVIIGYWDESELAVDNLRVPPRYAAGLAYTQRLRIGRHHQMMAGAHVANILA